MALILIASRDRCVQNAAAHAYARAAENCDIQMVIGGHSLHRRPRTQKLLIEHLVRFFGSTCADRVDPAVVGD